MNTFYGLKTHRDVTNFFRMDVYVVRISLDLKDFWVGVAGNFTVIVLSP